jgi:tryptophan synthase alpha chain
MGRIEDAFARRAAEGKKTLVTYLCVGDPDEAESVELAVACADAGADVLELGCPFSDPTADGAAIARASQRRAPPPSWRRPATPLASSARTCS